MEKNQSLQLLGGSAQGLQQELTGGEEGHGISRLGCLSVCLSLSLSFFFFFLPEKGEKQKKGLRKGLECWDCSTVLPKPA